MNLPPEALYSVLDDLGDQDLVNLCRVSSAMVTFCQQSSYWPRRIAERLKFPGREGDNFQTYQLIHDLLQGSESRDLAIEYLMKTNQEELLTRYLNYLRQFPSSPDLVGYLLGYLGLPPEGTWTHDWYLRGVGRRGQREKILQVLSQHSTDDLAYGLAQGGHQDLLFELIDQLPLPEGPALLGTLRGNALIEAIIGAAESNQDLILDQLIARGKINLGRAVERAISTGQTRVLRKLLQKYPEGVTRQSMVNYALRLAATGAQPQVVRDLIKMGARRPEQVLREVKRMIQFTHDERRVKLEEIIRDLTNAIDRGES